MDDKKLANYYDEQKAKGAGARFAKAGLGFASPGSVSPPCHKICIYFFAYSALLALDLQRGHSCL